MFGSHKRDGKNAGIQVRNTFASVALGSRVFEFGVGFVPPPDFFEHPYVLGFSTMNFALMRDYVFGGRVWKPEKSGEYMMAAFQEFTGCGQNLDKNLLIDQINYHRGTTLFTIGQNHAEVDFGAVMGILKDSDNDPIVLAARKMAQGLPDMSAMAGGKPDRNAGFKYAVLQLTVKEFLLENYPSQ